MKEKLLSCLPADHPWRSRVQVFDTLASTNTHAVTLAREGAPEGTVIRQSHLPGTTVVAATRITITVSRQIPE